MNVSDYHYARTEEEKPLSADTSVWFSYGDAGKEVYYGVSAKIQEESMAVYALTQTGEVSVTKGNENPIRQDLLGHFIAALPMTEQDIDGDGEAENVYDYARADFGLNAFNPAPQRFLTEEIPFELVFAERKYIMAYYGNEILKDAEVLVTTYNGERKKYRTDEHGWIQGLPNRDIREGFTASYSPDGEVVYRMHYALEDYPYFSVHFWKAHLPLMVIFALTGIGIVMVYLIRNRMERNNPAYAIYTPVFRQLYSVLYRG